MSLDLPRILGREHVVGGVARISAEIAEPGVVVHHSSFASIEFGELDGSRSSRLQKFLSTAQKSEIKAQICDDINAAIWKKFIMLASFSAITALTRLPAGPIRDTPESWNLLEAAAHETGAVARARGVHLGENAVGDAVQAIHGLPDAMKSSMLMDLERGNRLELEWLSGAVCRLGREAGVDTPVHRVVLAALMPFASGDR